jgi:hypothetical protein
MARTADIAAYENILRQIRGVLAAQVVVAPSGEVDEVHVLAGPGRGAKQIVRDVESALAAQFGVNVDHKRVSVAHLRGPGEGSGEGRLRLQGVQLTIEGVRALCRVELEWDGQSIVGEAEGPASTTNRRHLPAAATFAALEQRFRVGHALALEDVVLCQIGGRTVALVSASVLGREGEQILVGCCLVRGDEREAIVRAALDAVNRRLARAQRPPAEEAAAPAERTGDQQDSGRVRRNEDGDR